MKQQVKITKEEAIAKMKEYKYILDLLEEDFNKKEIELKKKYPILNELKILRLQLDLKDKLLERNVSFEDAEELLDIKKNIYQVGLEEYEFEKMARKRKILTLEDCLQLSREYIIKRDGKL